jgi:hypothetical protein
LAATLAPPAAEAGEATAPEEALEFLAAARRFAALVAEDGVPDPDELAAAAEHVTS